LREPADGRRPAIETWCAKERFPVGNPKIVLIGAGSTVFSRALLGDIFAFPELQDSEIALMDIDPARLRDTELVAYRLIARTGADVQITGTTERRSALAGADYVFNLIQVGGYRPSTVIDFEIPKRYGLRQTIGDTLGIGGIMRALRTIPVMLSMAREMEELCPNALLINYTNPMAMLCWAMNRATDIETIGLCHSVQGTAGELARVLGIPSGEIDYFCAGINHMAFYLKFERDGQDLYPALKAIAESGSGPVWDRVRFEVLRRFGYSVTESSEHFSEYSPWFIKSQFPEMIDRFNIPLDEYPARCEDQLADWAAMRAALLSDDPAAIGRYEEAKAGRLSAGWTRRMAPLIRDDPAKAEEFAASLAEERQAHHAGPSGEYGALIIHSMETGQPRVINGNVANDGLIDNLPQDCCVEVPCLIDKNGVQPTHVGILPPQLAALMQTNINVQGLTVEAALTGKREHIYHAAMLDPHTAAELPIDKICAMVDELIAAHGEYLPAFN
jgi:alpha-galactosidase